MGVLKDIFDDVFSKKTDEERNKELEELYGVKNRTGYPVLPDYVFYQAERCGFDRITGYWLDGNNLTLEGYYGSKLSYAEGQFGYCKVDMEKGRIEFIDLNEDRDEGRNDIDDLER